MLVRPDLHLAVSLVTAALRTRMLIHGIAHARVCFNMIAFGCGTVSGKNGSANFLSMM